MRLVWTLVLPVAMACAPVESGILQLRILDAGFEVPARVEVLDALGNAFAASDALLLHFECEVAPLPEWLRGPISSSDRLHNKRTGTDQFYTAGTARLELPPGRYRVRAFKGIEYRVARAEVDLAPGDEKTVDLELERWIDMPARGWYGVDDHVHITRRTADDDRRIATWMRAEDLHIANLLQMGTVDQFGVTPQHDFGEAGEFRLGDTLLISGQEHPRTHFLGHTITLGAERPVDRRDTYIVYETTFRAALEARGLPGYAHFGLGPARDGLALDAPRGLVYFLEVLQFASPHYDVWYGLLDLGVRIAPTAGTDFPCGPWSVPGAERFYARLGEGPTRSGLLDAVRAGRTFVTNGPLLDLRVGTAGIGEELVLSEAGPVAVAGRVRFDPERDDVKRVELLRNGLVVPAVPAVGRGEIRVEWQGEERGSAWWALRVEGDKMGAAPMEPLPSGPIIDFLGPRLTNVGEAVETLTAYHTARAGVRPSLAHTAPVWVRVGDSAAAMRALAKPRAEEALRRLDDLERRLADDRIEEEAIWDWVPYSDGVSIEHLRRNRTALLRAIEEARNRYREILAPTGE
ncbi:MAG: CehA/McbA family metallohydrolase [Myxococcota bacterium]